MEHAASIGAGASAAHAAPAAPAAGSSARAASAPGPAGHTVGTAVSISHEGQARAESDVGDGPDPVLLAAHLALAAFGAPDGLVGDVVQVAAGYAAQAGLDLAGRIDEIA